MVGVSRPGRQARKKDINTFQITNYIILLVLFVFEQQLKWFICVCLTRQRCCVDLVPVLGEEEASTQAAPVSWHPSRSC